jgi:short subunit dehydrogenase-like uncharacterized protein
LREGDTRIWGEVRNARGEAAVGELTTGNAYAFTADAAVTSMQRVLAGELVSERSGFLTPSLAFGRDYVTTLAGVEWTVEPRHT